MPFCDLRKPPPLTPGPNNLLFHPTSLKERAINAKGRSEFLPPPFPFSPLCALASPTPRRAKSPATSFPLHFPKHRNTSQSVRPPRAKVVAVAAPKVTGASRPLRQSPSGPSASCAGKMIAWTAPCAPSVRSFATRTLENGALRMSQTSESHAVVFLLRRSLFRPTLLLFFFFFFF